MLERLTVRGFKSLRDVTFEPAARLSVLFGPNAAGKSNLLEATQALSAMAESRTLREVLGPPLPVRGHPIESFAFPPDGIPALFGDNGPGPVLTLEADLVSAAGAYRYRISPRLHPATGRLSVADEYLDKRPATGRALRPAIESLDGRLHIRRNGRLTRSPRNGLDSNRSVLSDHSLSGSGYEWLDTVRSELEGWRIYSLAPRFRMRAEQSLADVVDIGHFGEDICPFLYKLRGLFPKHYDQVSRLLHQCVPEIERLDIMVNEVRGTLDLTVFQSGIRYSSRVMSEGTLRAIAYCAIAVNPWSTGGLVAVEEPENGVHPQRLEMIARLLLSVAEKGGKQVIVATHSPLFVSTIAAAKRQSDDPEKIGLFHVCFDDEQTVVERFEIPDAVFDDAELAVSLSDRGDQSVVEGLIMRNMIRA